MSCKIVTLQDVYVILASNPHADKRIKFTKVIFTHISDFVLAWKGRIEMLRDLFVEGGDIATAEIPYYNDFKDQAIRVITLVWENGDYKQPSQQLMYAMKRINVNYVDVALVSQVAEKLEGIQKKLLALSSFLSSHKLPKVIENESLSFHARLSKRLQLCGDRLNLELRLNRLILRTFNEVDDEAELITYEHQRGLRIINAPDTMLLAMLRSVAKSSGG